MDEASGSSGGACDSGGAGGSDFASSSSSGGVSTGTSTSGSSILQQEVGTSGSIGSTSGSSLALPGNGSAVDGRPLFGELGATLEAVLASALANDDEDAASPSRLAVHRLEAERVRASAERMDAFSRMLTEKLEATHAVVKAARLPIGSYGTVQDTFAQLTDSLGTEATATVRHEIAELTRVATARREHEYARLRRAVERTLGAQMAQIHRDRDERVSEAEARALEVQHAYDVLAARRDGSEALLTQSESELQRLAVVRIRRSSRAIERWAGHLASLALE